MIKTIISDKDKLGDKTRTIDIITNRVRTALLVAGIDSRKVGDYNVKLENNEAVVTLYIRGQMNCTNKTYSTVSHCLWDANLSNGHELGVVVKLTHDRRDVPRIKMNRNPFAHMFDLANAPQ